MIAPDLILRIVQELSLYLIDIHSQQQTQELSDEAVQFKIIDAIARINRNLKYQEGLKNTKQKKRHWLL